MKVRLTLRNSDPAPDQPAEVSFELGEGDRCVVGRGSTTQVVCAKGAVSREHCVFALVGGELMLSDLKSSGGTWLNHQRITGATAVRAGFVINIGQVQLDVLALELVE